MNAADLVIGILLLLAVAFALRKVIRNRRNKTFSCGCCSGNCDACAVKSRQAEISRQQSDGSRQL